MDISVVIPLYNEEESIPELSEWIDKVMKTNNYTYEIIFVDDGSSDDSWEVIKKLKSQNNNIKAKKFRRNYGKAAGLHTGFEIAKGNVVITMDADLQDSPEEIPGLYKMIIEEKYDLVSGWKKKRFDPIFSKNLPSKLFNFAARVISGIKLHDFNCGLKAYKNKVIKAIEIYGEMHRYIPILAKEAGFKNIGEKVVEHQKRKYGVTKYGLNRFINGFLDLLSVAFVTKFIKKPMHFFGALGTMFFLIGFVILVWLSYAKYALDQYKMTERPLFFLGLLAIIFGSQLFLTGFLGDIISRNSSIRNDYQIEEEL
ncbi:MAG: glycosyltransferase family 2 protein [Bacteroidales bacterium]|nr:glycosyltransferase family 2 protein [Bacteroidales bacterium]